MRFIGPGEKIGCFPERKTFQTLEQRKIYPTDELKRKLIKDVVKKSLIEFALSLAFVGMASFFIATPMGVLTLAACTVAVFAINILGRTTASYCIYKLSVSKYSYSSHVKSKKIFYSLIKRFAEHMGPGSFGSLIDKNTRDILFHELGHAAVAKALVKNPRIKISLVPFQGGSTSYRLGALTKIGSLFGRANVKTIVTVAGPACSVITATVGYGISRAIEKKHPEVSLHLKALSISSICNQAFYALSALTASIRDRGHDFVQLWIRGVHPIVSVISIVALPLLVKFGFFIKDQINRAKELKEAKKIAEQENFHKNKFYQFKIPSRLTNRQKELLYKTSPSKALVFK